MSDGLRRFQPGEVIQHRMPFVDESGASGPPRITDIKPKVVVEDRDGLIALWLAAGTPTIRAVPLVPGQPKPWRTGSYELVESTWAWCSALFLIVPGEWRATWVLWSPEGEFMGWYVNLQEPIVRTPAGFDVRDLQLDIRVDAERHWRWKDEDDLERSVEAGVISPEVAARTRAEGEHAVRDIESGAWPFTGEWNAWHPDPSWPVPAIPEVRSKK